MGGLQRARHPACIAVDGHRLTGIEGTVSGLHISLKRLLQTVLPPVMGAVVAVVGLTDSFYWVGGTLLALSLGLWAISRPPAST